MGRPLGAHVAGSDAFLLDAFLRRHQRELDAFVDRLAMTGAEPGRLRSLRDVVNAIHTAAEATSATSARKDVAGGAGSGLAVDIEITVKEASHMLLKTESWVRQLLRNGELDGRQVDGRWQVSRSAVLARLEVPRSDAA